MPEITLGNLGFIGKIEGGHIRVSVRGPGAPGDRPLLGELRMDVGDWAALRSVADTIHASGTVLADLRRRADAAEADVAKQDGLHMAEIQRLDLAVAKGRSDLAIANAEIERLRKLVDPHYAVGS
jgi:hypothetical protein